MPLSVIRNIVARRYSDFRGIDLLNAETDVDPRRSPDCLNVWKSYNLSQSNIIQTRPGVKLVKTFKDEEEDNNIIYSIGKWGNQDGVVHIGDRLINSEDETVLFSGMAENESVPLPFQYDILVLDGEHYIVTDSQTATDYGTAPNDSFIPTTSIGRSPSGGGEIYQDINLLQPKRKNSFVADGTSQDFYLDATFIDSVDSVYVNDTLVPSTNYSVTTSQGKIHFNTAPTAPGVRGQDNVLIEFTKTVSNYASRISNCTIMKVFDNRVFFSGNPDFPNVVFHSALNNATYISDLNYYECGSKDNPIKDMVVGNNILWIFKESSQEKDVIFYLSPTLDVDRGRIYPVSQGNVSIGCYSKAISYKDNILFFSRNGLEGINGNIHYEQSVTHKSSLIDPKLTNMSNYQFVKLGEFGGYLVVAVDDTLFLADYRQLFNGVTGTEFEWYVWRLPVLVSSFLTSENKLYFGDNDGNIYEFDGTNDLGEAFESYWVTPRDTFGYMQHLKKINKRGAILKIKNIQNGRLKIAEKTNKAVQWKLIKEVAGNGFNYTTMDYSNFSYSTTDNTYVVFRVKEKKIIDISLKIYSDMKDKPFGLSEISLEAFISGYVKR